MVVVRVVVGVLGLGLPSEGVLRRNKKEAIIIINSLLSMGRV